MHTYNGKINYEATRLGVATPQILGWGRGVAGGGGRVVKYYVAYSLSCRGIMFESVDFSREIEQCSCKWQSFVEERKFLSK